MAKLLLVEDNKPNRRMIKRKLASNGHDVIEAGDGETAVELTRDEQPDLVLMDLSLPRMDGWEATSEIRDDEHVGEVPVVAITAHAMDGDRDTAIQAGCDDYLSKPIDFDDLFSTVDGLLRNGATA